MLLRIIIFLLGFALTLIGFIYIFIYLNLLTIGYNFSTYVKFISGRIECWYFFIGLVLILSSIFMLRRKE